MTERVITPRKAAEIITEHGVLFATAYYSTLTLALADGRTLDMFLAEDDPVWLTEEEE